MEKNYIIANWLHRDLPAAQLVIAEDTLAALQLVSTGKADAYIGNLAVAAYLIKHNGLTNLKVAAPSAYQSEEFSFGVRKDWPQLATLLDKALESFSLADHDRIRNHWLSVRYEYGIRPQDVLYAISVLTTIALIIILPLYVIARQRSKQLAENKRLLNAIMDNSFQFQGLLSIDGRILDINRAPLALVGLDKHELLGHYLWETPWWSHDRKEQERLQTSIEQVRAGEFVRFETTHIDVEGKTHYIDFSLKPLVWDKGRVEYLISEGRDITPLIEREQRLKQSEQRFQKIFDESPLSMAVNDLEDETFISVNQKFCKTYGVTKEQVIGHTARDLDFLCPAESERLLKRIRKKGRIENEEIVSQNLNGEKRHNFFSATFLNFGDKTYALAMLVDITERKKSQELLRLSEEKYRQLFENAPIGIFRSSLSGPHIMVNTVMAQMFGYASAEEMIASVEDIAKQCYVEPTQRDLFIQKLSDGKETISEEVHFLKQDGSTFIGRIFIQEDKTSRGQKRIFSGFIVDMTKEKAAAQALRESEEKLRTITAGLNDVIWELDSTLNFTFVSPSVQRIQGWSEQEMLNLSLHDVLPRNALDAALKMIDEELMRGQKNSGKHTRMLQLEILRKDGSSFWGEISSNFILDASGVQRIISIVRDISERKKTEQIMIEAEKMLMISGLAAGLAHEINNPLGIILQNLQNIERRLLPQLEANRQVAEAIGVNLDAVREYLKRREILSFIPSMRHAGERAAKIVSNMLTFSRKGGGTCSPAQINQVIDQSIEIAQSDYDLKKKYDIRAICFVREYACDLPPVMIEKTEIEQVLVNLFKKRHPSHEVVLCRTPADDQDRNVAGESARDHSCQR